MRVIPLQHASALDLAQTVTRLLSDGGMGASAAVGGGGIGGDASLAASVIGDPRTNSLLVRSRTPQAQRSAPARRQPRQARRRHAHPRGYA